MYWRENEPGVKPMSFTELRNLKNQSESHLRNLKTNVNKVDSLRQQARDLRNTAQLRRDQARTAARQTDPGAHSRQLKAVSQARSAANQATQKSNEANNLKPPSLGYRDRVKSVQKTMSLRQGAAQPHNSWAERNYANGQLNHNGLRVRRWAADESAMRARQTARRGVTIGRARVFSSSGVTERSGQTVGFETTTIVTDPIRIIPPLKGIPNWVSILTDLLDGLCQCIDNLISSIQETVTSANNLADTHGGRRIRTDEGYVRGMGATCRRA